MSKRDPMTQLEVISPLTTIGNGKVELGEVPIDLFTVGEVKKRVEEMVNVPTEEQVLWWRGYVLDCDTLPLVHACVGVNEGEEIDRTHSSLVIFMTEEIKRDKDAAPSNTSSFRPRLRSASFDIEKVRMELRKQRETISNCIIV